MNLAAVIVDDMKTFQRNNGRWYVEYYDAVGKRCRKSLDTTDARLAQDRFQIFAYQRTREERLGFREGTTFYRAIADYLGDLKLSVKPSTITRYEPILERMARFFGGDLPLSLLDVNMLRKYRNIRCQADKHHHTVDYEIAVLRGFLNWCIANRWLEENIADHKHIKPLIRKSQKTSSRRIFTDEELEKLLNPPESEYWQLRYQFATLYYTGMRIAELAYLQVKDVDLARREIRIGPKKMRIPLGRGRQSKEIEWSPKSHEERIIPIDPRLEPILRKFQAQREENIWKLYFRSASGNQVSDHLSRRVKKITGKDDVSLHTFRHTHISHALNRWGRQPSVVQKMVGHKDLATTQLYIHVSREDLHREAGKVGR